MTDNDNNAGAAAEATDKEKPVPESRIGRLASARWLLWLVFALVLGFYSFCQIRGFTPAYAEVDPDAYLFMAKRIALGEPLLVKDDTPFLYQNHMWVEKEPGQVTAKYPPGYPILMAAGYLIAGDKGMFMISPIMGGLALLGAWLLFQLWLKPPYAVMAFLTLGFLSQYHFYCAYLLTHAASLCLTTWGMYFLWRWLERPGIGWGIAAGVALGATVSIRPTDGLFILPMLVAAGAGLWRERKTGKIPWTPTCAMLAAWGLMVGLLAIYNDSLFGGPTLTGYAFSGEQDAFTWRYFSNYFELLIGGLSAQFLPLFFTIGLAGMMLWGPPVERMMRLLWFLPIFLVYGSYYWVNGDWSYLRFFMSTLPVCIASAYALLETLAVSKTARRGTILSLLFIFLCLQLSGLRNALSGEPIGRNPRELARTADKLAAAVPSDAVIFSFEPLVYSMGPREKWTVYPLEAFNRDYGVARFRETDRKRKESEPRRQPERTKRMREFYNSSTAQGLLDAERDTVRTSIASGRTVFMLLQANQREKERQKLGPGFEFKTIEEWDLKWDQWRQTYEQRWGIYSVTLSAPPPGR